MALTDAQREAIYRLRLKKPNANGLFKHLAEMQQRRSKTSVSVVEGSSGLSRTLSLELMREIAETGVAAVHGDAQAAGVAWGERISAPLNVLLTWALK